MVDRGTAREDTVIRDRSGRLGLLLNPETGLPTALLFRHRGAERSLPVVMSAILVTGGEEVFVPPRGLGYKNTRQLGDFSLTSRTFRRRLGGPEETYAVSTVIGDWEVVWEYTFRQSHPRIEINVEVSSTRLDSKATLRDLRIDLDFTPEDLSSWRVEAPGNQLRPGVVADAFTEPVAVSPAGGVRGSTGLVALHQPRSDQVLVLWPFSQTEIGDLSIASGAGTLHFRIDTGLAGRLDRGESLRYGAIELDALEGAWEEVRDGIPAWYAPLGMSTPRDKPDWLGTASIFEVQIGYSVFWEGYRYEPYPTVSNLLADLGRIRSLGYDVIQIMPRQPYPSYNVHDYADVTTSYGDEKGLRRVVEAAHALGMRVILDILLHGVIDREVVARTAERVRSGPYRSRLAEDTTGAWGSGRAAVDAMNIAWSRHILDFEPYWHEDSPARHPLLDAHPEWFMRDSAGRVIGIYTNAFDVANIAWQEYFADAAEELVRRLDIDGFRFDAPTYNDLPNWSAATRSRASYSPLGSLQLFDRLRTRLKRLKEDILLYTEPSGVLFHRAMDLTYNYDEQWLPEGVLRPPKTGQADRTSVRNGRELAAWFRDRNAVLPKGALIAHHVDSHDTFWWPLPGEKWRREQYGIEATRALLAVFGLSGGAYMTFVGGEEGLEEDVRRMHRLRNTYPEIGRGAADYEAFYAEHEAVYVVARRAASGCAVLLVNLSEKRVETDLAINSEELGLDGIRPPVYDAWNDLTLAADHRYGRQNARLRRLPISFDPYQTRLLILRPVSSG